MKKTVLILALVVVAAFLAAVWYGIRFRHGPPVPLEKPQRIILPVLFLESELALSGGIHPEIWDSMEGRSVEMLHQTTVLPWSRALISPVTVKAFHNATNIYFCLQWNDDTWNAALGPNEFSDACAIAFPLGNDVQPASIMMGFLGKVNIWQWKASQDREYWGSNSVAREAYADYHYPFEETELLSVSRDRPSSAVNDLIAIRVATVTPKELPRVAGRGSYNKGSWQVVFKRSLGPEQPELDAGFPTDQNRFCAFALWNGAAGERGGRKSISEWVELEIRK